MKKIKLAAIIILSSICLVALAQAVKQDINSSSGNGKAMENNLNEPNATNPANHNCQKYEKEGVIEKNNHPDKNLSNSYDRTSYEEKKK